jgi:hypothetical protein
VPELVLEQAPVKALELEMEQEQVQVSVLVQVAYKL